MKSWVNKFSTTWWVWMPAMVLLMPGFAMPAGFGEGFQSEKAGVAVTVEARLFA